MKRIAALALVLAACSQQSEPANNSTQPMEPPAANVAAPAIPPNGNVPVPIPGNSESPPVQPAPPPPVAGSEKTAAAAAAVLRDYFRLIERKDYAAAHRLWSSSADDLSDGAFAASFDKYRSYHAVVGPAGDMEGAAGSSYIDFPVTVTGELKSGGSFRLAGPVTLRRVNDVPGATAEQLRWRIMRSSLKPRP